MQSNFYVGMSGQMAIDRRLQSVANNIANMNTPGFRADGVTFSTILSNANDAPVAFSSQGTDYISRRTGELTKTDNPLDVAVQGDGYMAIKTPGGTVYTRDGRMKMDPSGQLMTLNNYPVLDAGGTGLLLDPNGGTPAISSDGMITQGANQVGAIGLFSIDPAARLTRATNSGVIPDKAATAVLDFTASGLQQGFVEGSNVNPVLELAKLITIQHALDGLAQTNTTADTSMNDAIKTLGGAS